MGEPINVDELFAKVRVLIFHDHEIHCNMTQPKEGLVNLYLGGVGDAILTPSRLRNQVNKQKSSNWQCVYFTV